jgi:hypothetical protein
VKGKITKIEKTIWKEKNYDVLYISGMQKPEGGYWYAPGKFKEGEEVEFTETKDDGKWKITFTGGFQKSDRGRKSPEELKQTMITMCLSYGKDVAIELIKKDLLSSADHNKIVQFTRIIADGYLIWAKEKMKEA